MKNNGDSKPSYRELWDEAYKKASFFKSDRNSKEYRDKAAEADADSEPVYRGSNSVRFAQKYLEEKNIKYRRIPYEYDYDMGNGEVRKIDFAYLVITK